MTDTPAAAMQTPLRSDIFDAGEERKRGKYVFPTRETVSQSKNFRQGRPRSVPVAAASGKQQETVVIGEIAPKTALPMAKGRQFRKGQKPFRQAALLKKVFPNFLAA